MMDKPIFFPNKENDGHEHFWRYRGGEPRRRLDLAPKGRCEPAVPYTPTILVTEECLRCGIYRQRELPAPVHVRLIDGIERVVEATGGEDA